jgi:hypothetical protein
MPSAKYHIIVSLHIIALRVPIHCLFTLSRAHGKFCLLVYVGHPVLNGKFKAPCVPVVRFKRGLISNGNSNGPTRRAERKTQHHTGWRCGAAKR